MKHVEPSTLLKAFNCPHCGAFSDQAWFDVFSSHALHKDARPFRPVQEHIDNIKADTKLTDEIRDDHVRSLERMTRGEVFFIAAERTLYSVREIQNLTVSRCFSCDAVSVWIHDRVAYPPLRSGVAPNPDLPAEIIVDFNEARAIVDVSPRGAAALLRLAIQKLCAHLGTKGKNINDDIATLVSDGLDVRVQRALDIVRVVGNEAVHPGQLDLRDDRDTANKLFGLVNLIAEKMISEPKHVDELYESLSPDKRAAIEERDSKKK